MVHDEKSRPTLSAQQCGVSSGRSPSGDCAGPGVSLTIVACLIGKLDGRCWATTADQPEKRVEVRERVSKISHPPRNPAQPAAGEGWRQARQAFGACGEQKFAGSSRRTVALWSVVCVVRRMLRRKASYGNTAAPGMPLSRVAN